MGIRRTDIIKFISEVIYERHEGNHHLLCINSEASRGLREVKTNIYRGGRIVVIVH